MSFTEEDTDIPGLDSCVDPERCIYASHEICISNSMYDRVYIIVVFGVYIYYKINMQHTIFSISTDYDFI